LQRIYEAAKLGLKGDSLALKAGMLPTEYRRLCEMDPIAEMAEQKGRADAEGALAAVMMDAALSGDTKAALEVLKHRFDWQTTQKVEVTGSQSISITAVLAQANARVNALIIDEAQERGNAPRLLTNQPKEAADGYADFDTEQTKRITSLRP
jgi:hypothetical protein